MRAIALTSKDLLQLLRDWKTALFLVAMPIVFTLLFGFVFSGASGEEDPRLPVGFVDQDSGGALGAHLLNLLQDSSTVRPILAEDGEDVAELERRVEEEEWAALLIVPAGYSARSMDGEPASLTIVVGADASAAETTRSAVQAAALRLQSAVQTARLTAQALETQSGASDDALRQRALQAALAAWADPPLTVSVSQSGAIEEEGVFRLPNAYAQSSPGVMVQFSMAGLMGAAEIILRERKSRTMLRLLTTTVSRPGIILGHFAAMLAMVLLQLLVLVAFGQFFLDVDYLRQPLALLVMVLAISIWAASLGLLIGVLARSEEQAIIFVLFPMLVLSGVGGAWMPLEFTSPTFQAVGSVTPLYWAMNGLQNLVVRGMGFESVLLPAGVLLAYATVFFGLAFWRFRFE